MADSTLYGVSSDLADGIGKRGNRPYELTSPVSRVGTDTDVA
jgi:hypothetical protein